MSAAEAALAPDPNSGSEHGIILVNETARSDFDTGMEISHHFRARIFANQGRHLADITIPFYSTFSDLRRWWGLVILPDGRCLELPREGLKEAILARSGISNVSVLKGALPGVVPGSVIDYGYEVWSRLLPRSKSLMGSTSGSIINERFRGLSWRFFHSMTVPIQNSWPTRDFRYRWRPAGWLPAAFYADRTATLGIVSKLDLDAVLLAGSDIPAVLDEPWSPPEEELRGSLTMYYRLGPKDQKEFWDQVAKDFNRRAEDFSRRKLVLEAMTAMALPVDGDLNTRLRLAYDWIGTHLVNLALRTPEQVEVAPDEADRRNRHTVKELLESREGEGWELDYLFLGVARALGADAHLVYTTDRRARYFHPELLSPAQLGGTLVAVRAPSEPDDKRVIVDAGSGLPYGQVAWWFTGLKGFLATSNGAADIIIRASEPVSNLSQTNAEITFDFAEGSASVHWTRTSNGQSGLEDRRQIRSMTPEQRSKHLDAYCGGAGDIEVSQAGSPGIKEDSGPLKIECDLTLMNTDPGEEADEFLFSFSGPWLEAIPEFTSETRTHPIVFFYPRVDRTTIEIQVPEGFKDMTVPSPVKLDTPFGRYVLDVSSTARGFRVERLFSLLALGVPQSDYAALRTYLTDVARADRTMLAFRRTSATP